MPSLQIVQVHEVARRRPRTIAVVHDDGEHRRQPLRAVVLEQPAVEDAHRVADQLQRGEALVVRLVVAQDVQQRWSTLQVDFEQKGGTALLQHFVDEVAVGRAQARPVDRRRDLAGQLRTQQLGQGLGIAEHEAEQRVVRTDRVHRPFRDRSSRRGRTSPGNPQ